MANPLQILVDDTSPSITYYPWADTLGAPNVLAGWNPYYTGSSFAAYQGEVGKGTSLHLTSLNGASFSIQWQGTGIQLYGNATQASYDLTLNGTPTLANSSSLPDSLLAEFHDLPDANYTLTLTVQSASPPTSDSFVAFDKALITSFSDVSASALTTQTVNDTDITFLGQWSFQSATIDSGFNGSFHQTNKTGDRVEVTFEGTTVTLYGAISNLAGNYSVTLDNRTTNLSGRSSFFNPDALLFYATELDDNYKHHLVVQNEEDRVLAIGVNGINYTSVQNVRPNISGSSTSSTVTDTRGTKAAIALAIILSFLLIFLLLAYIFIYRPRRRRKILSQRSQRKLVKEDEAASVLDISTEGRDIAERQSSFHFTGIRFGKGSPGSNHEDIEINSNGSWNSLKRGQRTRDPQSQWESFTVDLPPTSYGGSWPHSYAHRSHLERAIISPSERMSQSPVRLGNGAPSSNDPHGEDGHKADTKSIHSIDSGYGGAVEMFLSPRTSEAVFLPAGGSPKQIAVDIEEDVGESVPLTSNTKRNSGDVRFLDVAAGSPFKVDFANIGASRRTSAKTKRKSALSRTERIQTEQPAAASKSEPPQEDQKGDSSSNKPVSQVPVSRFSFLDFSPPTPSSSEISKASSRSSKRTDVDKSAETASQVASVPRPERISNPRSVSFDVPSSTSSSSSSQPQSSSFPYPMALHVIPPSSQHLQVPLSSSSNPPQRTNSRRLSVSPMGPRPLSTSHNTPAVTPALFPSSGNNSLDSDSIPSPTASLPMTVSDIYFRTVDGNSESASRRTSLGSPRSSPHPALPGTVSTSGAPTPVPDPLTLPPKIVQKLLGMNQPSGSLLAGGSGGGGTTSSPGNSQGPSQDYIQSRPALPRTESSASVAVSGSGPTPSTPFMQRMLEIGSAVLTPRYGQERIQSRNQSQSQSQSQNPSGDSPDTSGPNPGQRR